MNIQQGGLDPQIDLVCLQANTGSLGTNQTSLGITANLSGTGKIKSKKTNFSQNKSLE